jgi:hypothetical protein
MAGFSLSLMLAVASFVSSTSFSDMSVLLLLAFVSALLDHALGQEPRPALAIVHADSVQESLRIIGP